jgi:hypothetical protein
MGERPYLFFISPMDQPLIISALKRISAALSQQYDLGRLEVLSGDMLSDLQIFHVSPVVSFESCCGLPVY